MQQLSSLRLAGPRALAVLTAQKQSQQNRVAHSLFPQLVLQSSNNNHSNNISGHIASFVDICVINRYTIFTLPQLSKPIACSTTASMITLPICSQITFIFHTISNNSWIFHVSDCKGFLICAQLPSASFNVRLLLPWRWPRLAWSLGRTVVSAFDPTDSYFVHGGRECAEYNVITIMLLKDYILLLSVEALSDTSWIRKFSGILNIVIDKYAHGGHS